MKSDLNYNIGFFQLFCNKKSLQHQNFLPTPAGSHFLIHLYSLAKIQRNPSSSRLQFSPSCISTFTVLNLQDSKHPNTCICTSLSCIRSCTLSDIQIRNTYLHQERTIRICHPTCSTFCHLRIYLLPIPVTHLISRMRVLSETHNRYLKCI